METPGWQARVGKGFDISAFTIDWENKRAICPNGKISGSWLDSKADYGMDIAYINFRKSDCSACPNLSDCTTCKTQRRTITVNARPYHEALEQARARQKTEEFKQEYKARAGIEGTISQGARAMDIKQARYKGLPKVELQHFATAAAINLVRLGAWWQGHPREKTRISHFQKLKHMAA
ncbi:MAG: transposase [Acidobacteriota bacterium]